MQHVAAFYRTSIGKKVVVAVTGALLVGFLVVHMLGNLTSFAGTGADGTSEIDAYARALRALGEPLLPPEGLLWIARGVLLGAFALHVVAVVQLARQNRAARPVGYTRVRYAEASRSARWMLWTGLVLLAFVVLHVLHLTTGTIAPPGFEPLAVYANLHGSFRSAPIALAYLVAMALLGLHLRHGVWSVFQTLGADSPERNRALRRLASWSSALLVVGFGAVPLAFLLGWLPAPR